MKTSLLVTFLFLVSFSVFCQSREKDNNFDKGVKAFQSENYIDAINFFTNSINDSSTSNSYFNRAVSYYYLGDSCNFCADLKKASDLGHADAPKLYDENCFLKVVNILPDSIKLKHPDADHLEINYEKCTHTSTTSVIYKKGDKTWSGGIEELKGEIFSIVESMPQYPGGENERNKLLAMNIIYPAKALQYGIQGTVYVSFIVEKDGSVSNVKVLRGIGGGCDEESVRVVKLMPKWIPGTQAGKPVRVLFNMPIYYRLQGASFPEQKK